MKPRQTHNSKDIKQYFFTVGTNISLQSILITYKKFKTNWAIVSLRCYFILNTNFKPMALQAKIGFLYF